MPDILVTGMPRSGTTLVMSLLSRQPDTLALAEPIQLERHGDRQRAIAEITAFLRDVRRAALAGAPVPTKQVNGVIPDNWVEPPRADGRLRQVLEMRSELSVGKQLSPDFTLIVKHPAEFTALADLLVDQYPLYAIVRDPLAVLAAWQTVNMPVQSGHMPMLECFHPEMKAQLAAIESPIARQVALIEFQLRTYLDLPETRVLRYEDIVADPASVLRRLCPAASDFPELSAVDPVARYSGVDLAQLAEALHPIRPLIERFYPDIEQRWASHLASGAGSLARASVPSSRQSPEVVPRDDAVSPTVYIMGGYIPAGGTRMAYEIGLIAHEVLGLAAKVITCDGESADSSVFDYPTRLETVPLADLAATLRPDDLLICNPSFTNGLIGLTHSCRKLMYVQGFNTFHILDGWFDHYVSVSSVVRSMLRTIYGRETEVIPPFITVDPALARPWRERPAGSIWFLLKGDGPLQHALLDRLRAEVRAISPAIADGIDWEGSVLTSGAVPQRQLLEKIAERRHLVTLAVNEGFGLVPLEAMALATTVLGFDGFGGKDYMRPGDNCLAHSYPNVRGVAQSIIHCLASPEYAETIAARGPATARLYTRQRFRQSWLPILRRLLGKLESA